MIDIRESGKRVTTHFYNRKLKWKAKQFNFIFPLHSYFLPMIGDKETVYIADLGAGMFSTTGTKKEGTRVYLYASDILVNEFNDILKKRGYDRVIPVEYQDMENLTYQDDFFDIVHCVNALDHVAKPDLALMEMFRVCKPGGYIYLRHYPNEATKTKNLGFHQWDISLEENECFFTSKYRRFKLSEIIPGFENTIKKVMPYEPETMVVSVYHKP